MSYQVIARKYRPQQFADVVGQEHVTRTLSHAIGQNRIAHAYLFCGPRGTGKTTIARIFAKALNCTGGPAADFDVADPKCVEIAEGRSMDVLEIDGASNNGVEQVRELRETCKYVPASSRFKIYIIDEVHMLSAAAFNALLKTLEEPPAHVKFMFATTDPEKVLPTILSRCQRFDLRRIPSALIVRHLAEISKKEKAMVDDAALYAIARGAEGAMRDAESTLDQLISFCGDKIEEADVLSMFGLTAQSQIIKLAQAVIAGDIESALRELNDLVSHGKDLGRLLSNLLNHFRNLLIYQISHGDLKLLEVSEAEARSLQAQSSTIGGDALTRIMEVLTDYEGRLRDAASKKILVEVAFCKAIEALHTVSLDAVLINLNELRGGASNAGVPAISRWSAGRPSLPAPTSPPTSTPPASPRVSKVEPPAVQVGNHAAKVGGAELEELWTKLVEAVGRASQFTRSYLMEAHPVAFNGSVFTIGFDPEFADHIALVDNTRNHTLLQTKLAEFGHPNSQIKFIKAETPVGRATRTVETSATVPISATKTTPASPKEKIAAGTLNKDDFKNDPLIQKALEIFKGQIVEVRG